MEQNPYAPPTDDTRLGPMGQGDDGFIEGGRGVPADRGDSGHEAILRDLRDHLPTIEKKMKKLGLPGVFLELEPHLKGGGQFGGFSGPDGMGVACRALCRLLDYVGLGYQLRTFDHIRRARGF